MCVSPYIATAKDGRLVPVPCGHCIECLSDWSNDWRFRLHQEWKRSDLCLYLTLTYDPRFLPVAYNDDAGEWQSYISKREVQLFLKRLRKNCPALKNNLRYFAIGEYGGDYNRAHYHLVLFIKTDPRFSYAQWHNLFFYTWSKGFIKLKRTEEKNIKYVTKYFNKLDDSPHLVKPFKLMSKSLGLCYLTDKMLDYFFECFPVGVPCPWNNSYQKLPRYYKKKLDEYSHHYLPQYDGCSTYSEVLSLQKFKSKGLYRYFNYFCKNFDLVYKVLYREALNECRIYGFDTSSILDYEKPNQVFYAFKSRIKEILDAENASNRKLLDIKVKHKYTKLYEQDLAKTMKNTS